jgi:hypothetical protein
MPNIVNSQLLPISAPKKISKTMTDDGKVAAFIFDDFKVELVRNDDSFAISSAVELKLTFDKNFPAKIQLINTLGGYLENGGEANLSILSQSTFSQKLFTSEDLKTTTSWEITITPEACSELQLLFVLQVNRAALTDQALLSLDTIDVLLV